MKKLLLTLLVATVIPCKAQIVDKPVIKKLDELISSGYGTIAPGCAVLVAEKGKVVYKKSWGKADLELNVTMNPEMVFRIGSITKQYTAIAILKLIEEGQISLDDSLQKFIPDFPVKEHIITVENLLTHTSGIVDYGQLNFNIPNAIRIDFPTRQLMDSVAILPLNFVPGSRYNYSNSNYVILGCIIEKVTGKSYASYLQESIFKPAGLHHTFYDFPLNIIPNRVSGYSVNDSGYKNVGYISMNHVFAAGALLSNVEDLFKWHQALHSFQMVKKETLEKALTPYRLSGGNTSDYGYGWFIMDFRGNKSISHGGAIDGFRSMETYFPQQDIFITVLLNAESDNFFTFFESISGLVMRKASQTDYKDMKIEDDVLSGYVGKYVFPEYPAEHIRIYKKDNKLYADLSNNTGRNMPLYAQSQTLFYVPVIKRIPTTIEFIVENGQVKGINWTQEKKTVAWKVE